LWQDLQLPEFELDLTVGEQKLAGQGSLGMPDSRLELDLAVSRLADLWPGLPGGARAKGWISGTLRQHATDLQATYTPADSQADKVGSAPIDAHVALQGGWGPLKQGQPEEGWRGRLTVLKADHAGLGLDMRAPLDLAFAPQAAAPDWQWRVGATSLAIKLPSGSGAVVRHDRSNAGGGRWETRGGIDKLVVSRAIIQELQALLPADDPEQDRGRVIVDDDDRYASVKIVFDADWDLKFAGALAGSVDVRRVSGDFIVP